MVTPLRKPAAPRWSVDLLQQAVLDALAEGEPDRAVHALVEALPALHASRMNPREKLNTLMFLSRAVQNAGGGKHGPAKLAAKLASVREAVEHLDLPAGGYLELGCGAHDPLAMALFFHLNGFAPAHAVDLRDMRNPLFSALSMYDLCAHVRSFPLRYRWGEGRGVDVLARLRGVDLAAFERGDFAAGLESLGDVHHHVARLETVPVAEGSIALLTSQAVLEHVDDLDAVMARCFALLAPGGVAYHFVDLVDHRVYRGDGAFGPLDFLAEPEAPAGCNRLRAPAMAEAASRAGFEIVLDRRIDTPVDPALRARLVAPFSAMPEPDFAVIKQDLVLRKPSEANPT